MKLNTNLRMINPL